MLFNVHLPNYAEIRQIGRFNVGRQKAKRLSASRGFALPPQRHCMHGQVVTNQGRKLPEAEGVLTIMCRISAYA